MGSLLLRYALERVIGRGASGTVWAANDLKLRRPVAIKQLDRQLAEDVEACSRFEREAWTIAQLRSPHIVQVFDSGVDQGVPFIVMERLHGENLQERLDRYRLRSRIPLRIAAGIIADIARGLTASHDAGIVHRDLKPGNVFLAVENRREIAKLLDFGIASITPDRAEPTLLAGTPQFMSPEHFEGQRLDRRADVWSLAVMSYEMLTGRLPFAGETLRELRTRICSGSFVPPSELVPELEPGVDGVFEKAFSLPITDRFASAAELAIALDQFAGDSARLPVARVLFVDDEPDLETLLRQRLRREVTAGRYELLFARNSDEGLALLSSRPDIDVVFADINMAGRGAVGLAERDPNIGREGLAFLAKVPEISPIVRVVMLSAHYENRDYVRTAMNHGAFDFLRKPIDFADLRKTIDNCAAETRKLRQLLASHQENDVLRALIGRSTVDRLVAEVRAADAAVATMTQATVALVWVPETRGEPGQPLLARLNAHFDLVVPEIHGQDGSVRTFSGDGLLALFQGREHLERGVNACIGVVERVRMANAVLTGESAEFSVAACIATGPILEGRLGSTLVGRVEPVLFGEPLTVIAELKSLCRPLEILVAADVQQAIFHRYRCEADAGRTTRQSSQIFRVVGMHATASGTDAVGGGQVTLSVAEP